MMRAYGTRTAGAFPPQIEWLSLPEIGREVKQCVCPKKNGKKWKCKRDLPVAGWV